MTKVFRRRQHSAACWIQTSLHRVNPRPPTPSHSLSPPLFNAGHAKTEFAVIPVLVRVFYFIFLNFILFFADLQFVDIHCLSSSPLFIHCCCKDVKLLISISLFFPPPPPNTSFFSFFVLFGFFCCC